MEPQVRYCIGTDGVRTAYTMEGAGPPLVFALWGPASIEFDHQLDEAANFYSGLQPGRTIVRYDHRGWGASDRDVAVTVDTFVGELASLIDHLRLETIDLFCGPDGCMAIAFAARYPNRVHRLVLWQPIERVAPGSDPVNAAQQLLVSRQWAGATRVLADIEAPHAPLKVKKWITKVYRSCWSPDGFARATAFSGDVSTETLQVECPTLVIYPRGSDATEQSKEIASKIPDCRIVAIDGDDPFLYLCADRLVPVVNEFLQVERSKDVDVGNGRGLRTILFTDLVGHTEMMRRLGDDGGRAVLREHERITRELLKQHGGAEVKTMGDGFMASFSSVTKAMDCAIALQRAFAAHEGEPLHVRVGLNAGEPIEEDGDLFGSTVIMASRIAAKVDAGEILIPEPLRHLLSGKSYVYADRGETMLKGFEDAVRLYEVRWRD